MKTLVKSFFMALVAVAATSAIAADMTTTIVSFMTQKGLKYGDGSDVLPGEYVALCFSSNAEFGGIEYNDGKFVATEEGDEVICAVPAVTEDGSASRTFLVKDRGAGDFYVFVLDTRSGADSLSGTTGSVTINGASEIAKLASNAESLSTGALAGGTDYNAAKYVSEKAYITISTVDGYPTVSAVGLSPILKYRFAVGTEPGKLTPSNNTFSAFNGESTITVTDGLPSKFFQLQPAE